MAKKKHVYSEIGQFEPLMPAETGELEDIAYELTQRSANLANELPAATLIGVRELLRIINSYYSNLIEGHNTHPIEVEQAMRENYSNDPAKRDRTLTERGLDFADAVLVFSGVTLEMEDTRKNYGEPRILCYGLLGGRMVVVGYTPRGADRVVPWALTSSGWTPTSFSDASTTNCLS